MGLLSAALVMAASTQATPQEYTFTTLAGPTEVGGGDADGPGLAAALGLRSHGPWVTYSSMSIRIEIMLSGEKRSPLA